MMIPENLYTQLGGTALYAELRGNYRLAAEIAQASYQDAQKRGSGLDQAKCLIAQALVCYLNGNAREGIRYAQQAREFASTPDQQTASRSLWVALHQECYNVFPYGGAPTSAHPDIQERWDGVAFVNEEVPPIDELRNTYPNPIWEARLYRQIHLNTDLMSGRYFVWNGRTYPHTPNQDQALEMALGACKRLYAFAEEPPNLPLQAAAFREGSTLHWVARNLPDAETWMNHAFALYQQAGDVLGEGLCYLQGGDTHAAQISTPYLWNLDMVETDPYLQADAEVRVAGEFLSQHPGIVTSKEWYEKAKNCFAETGAPRTAGALCLRFAYLAAVERDWEACESNLSNAVTIFTDTGDHRNLQIARLHICMMKLHTDRWYEAREIATDIGKWAATEGSYSMGIGLGKMLTRVGEYFRKQGAHFERALRAYQLAQRIFTELDARSEMIDHQIHQGIVFQQIGFGSLAIARFERAYSQLESQPNFQSDSFRETYVLKLLNALFSVYMVQADADGIEMTIARMETVIPDEAPQQVDPLAQLQELFSAFGQSGMPDFDPALQQERILAFSNRNMSGPMIPLYRGRKAKSEAKPTTAKVHFEEALQKSEQLTGSERLMNRAFVYGFMEEDTKALEAWNAYWAAQDQSAFAVMSVANTGGETARIHEAANRHERALALLVRIRAYEEAAKHLLELEKLRGADWWKYADRPWLNLTDIGEVHEALGNYEQALTAYQQGIGLLEERRAQLSSDQLKIELAGDKGTRLLYFQACRAALKQVVAGYAEEMPHVFEFAEKANARSLADLVATTYALPSNVSEHHPLWQWREKQASLHLYRDQQATELNIPYDRRDLEKLKTYEQQLEILEGELAELEHQIRKTDPEVLTADASMSSLQEVQQALAPNEILIQYYYDLKDFMAWVITPESVRPIYKIWDRVELIQQVRTFYQACHNGRDSGAVGKELTTSLLIPFEEELSGAEHIYFALFGEFHRLPFHALPFHDLPLGIQKSISILPNASLLPMLKNRPEFVPEIEGMLSIGNPTLDLISSSTEAIEIADMFPQSELLIEESATKDLVKERLSAYAYLHIATHGKFVPDSPLESSLELAGGEEISVRELMGMQLPARLVVLSACDSGQGEISGGDDVVGLIRGLLAAGVEAAVVSLWPVNDIATSLFMREFYRHIRDGARPATALMEAQCYLYELPPEGIRKADGEIRQRTRLSTRSSLDLAAIPGIPDSASGYQHPYFWAPFVLVGR